MAICLVSKPYAAFYGVLLFITGYVVGWLEEKAGASSFVLMVLAS